MGHRASFGLHFFNSLNEDVKLVPENGVEVYSPECFQPFDEQVVPPHEYYHAHKELIDYEEADTLEETGPMQIINVIVGNEIAGCIYIIRAIVPDPIVSFGNNEESFFKLQIQRSRFGGPIVLEIVPKCRRVPN